MLHRYTDITGQRFGKLVVQRYSHIAAGRNAVWECLCEGCGKLVLIPGQDLRRGHSTQCGDCRYTFLAPVLTGQVQGSLTIGAIAGTDASRSRVYFVGCACGHTFKAGVRKLKGRTQCGKCSRKESQQRLAQEAADRRAQKKLARQAAVAAKTVTKTATCPVCDKDFDYQHIEGATEQKYCSLPCRNKAINTIRRNCQRAREFNVPSERVDSYTVFARDAWTCQLCGMAVDRELRGVKRNTSPEVDHPFPMERGGPNTYANAQTVCYGCHKEKSHMERLDSTAVVCVETGESFDSMAQVAKRYGVNRTAVSDALRLNEDGSWRGLHFLVVAKSPKADDVQGWAHLDAY